MTKTMMNIAVGLFMLFAMHPDTTQARTNHAAAYRPTTGGALFHYAPSADWVKSTTGTWSGVKDGATYWYKLDKKGGLWWSTDGKKWASVKDGTWMDKSGKWIRIHDKKLVWSADGKSWSEVPEWKWQGSDGKWYKFDTDWTLWINE